MTTSERWIRAVEEACAEPDPVRSNQLITRLHYLLSEALAGALGRDGGPNFHTWAVWGSRKAGMTIRQEDLDSAIRNATITAGVVGTLIGAVTGVFAGRYFGWTADYITAAIGAGIGTLNLPALLRHGARSLRSGALRSWSIEPRSYLAELR